MPVNARLTLEVKAELLNLAERLEREQSGDREKITAAPEQSIQQVQARWRKLEAHIGRPVSEFEPWGWVDEIHQWETAQREQKIRAWGEEIELKDYPHLVAQDLGTVWRCGANGLAAYYICDLLRSEGEPQFVLFSRFAQILQNEERLGIYSTLREAYQAGETYLRTITPQIIREKTDYPEPLVERLLARLPPRPQESAPAEPEPAVQKPDEQAAAEQPS